MICPLSHFPQQQARSKWYRLAAWLCLIGTMSHSSGESDGIRLCKFNEMMKVRTQLDDVPDRMSVWQPRVGGHPVTNTSLSGWGLSGSGLSGWDLWGWGLWGWGLWGWGLWGWGLWGWGLWGWGLATSKVELINAGLWSVGTQLSQGFRFYSMP